MKNSERAKNNELVPKVDVSNPEDYLNANEIKLFRGIQGIKAADDLQMVTPEQAAYYAKELKRCKNDPVYFAEKYFTIISYRGKEIIKLYDKQKEMLYNYYNYPFNIVVASRQSGKCISRDSIITVRDKSTGKITRISIGDLWENEK